MFRLIKIRQDLALIFLFILLHQFFFKVGALGLWLYHQDELAKTVCINKDNPDSDCNGSCQLNVAFNKAEGTTHDYNGTSKNPFLVLKSLKIDAYLPIYTSPFIINPIVEAFDVKTDYPLIVASVLQGFTTALFHPPNFNNC